MTKIFTSREFNQDVARAKRATADGPVIITDRGHPSHVLLTIEEYRRLTGKGRSLAEALGMKEGADIEFEPGRLSDDFLRPVDFDYVFLADTNVLSELRKATLGRANPGVVAWVEQTEAESIFISPISLMELEIGILRCERHDPAQARILRRWMVEQVLPEFRERVLAFDSAAGMRCASLHVPNRRSDRDAMIAAIGLVHGLTVVTRNTRDFEGTGVPLLDPWTLT